jgi:hypothetical protein
MRRNRSGLYLPQTNSSRNCSRHSARPALSTDTNVTPSIPGAPLLSLASLYAACNVCVLHTWTYRPQKRHDGSAYRLRVYPSSQVLQFDRRVYHIACASRVGEEAMNGRARLLHGCYPASTRPRTRPPPSRDRPISWPIPAIRPTLLHRLLDGTMTASPVAWAASLSPCCPYHRAGALRRPGQDPSNRIAFASNWKARPPSVVLSGPPMGSLALRPGDSLTTLKVALSAGFRTWGFPPLGDSSYRALDARPGRTFSR